jgi:hypothetical protein
LDEADNVVDQRSSQWRAVWAPGRVRIAGSEALIGYRVSVERRPAFSVTGYTLIVPPGRDELIADFWREVRTDGRLAALAAAAPEPPWLLGLGSWDPDCEPGGQRYTVCVEDVPGTDYRALIEAYGPGALYAKQIGASEWLRFELTQAQLEARFWTDNPYKMMGALGYRFHMGAPGDFSVGLHFDAYPPGYDPVRRPEMEFWITVTQL